ncbi:unnamed protein product [Rotaria sordida]|uniref:Uncharacterized protein n=1 Tax=Rotaria sordida TaxID=392033 RepID=A0A813TG19_9BILA|nr:unnamed protein product [Rotaria sordida]CAF0811997.1 unnamed protein product [Rotaria sordida]CAF0876835.1 unnamed protein product [Rotaria sordida]CAF3540274.1 unnamed protein product [Rotaria sordida]CAF3728048.1 unnamed protein product [Rotaria sordida]
MNQLSSDISESIIHNHNNNNSEDQILSIGSASTLKRAMTVKTLNEMFDCIKDMKFYAKTIEQDLPEYFKTRSINKKNEIDTMEFEIDDFIQLAKQRLNNNRYILLNDLIEQKKKSNESQLQQSIKNNYKKSLVEKQVEYMKRVIAAQPSALEAIYLEALLNPDQWQYNHHLLQTSPMDNLTSNERKRLNEILNKYE